LEENCVCSGLGRIGLAAPQDQWSRVAFLKYATIMNLIGFFLTCYAALAFTEDFSLLRLVSYSTAELTTDTTTTTNTTISFETVQLYLGLRAVALDNPNHIQFGGNEQVVVSFDQFCDLTDLGLEKYMDPADCDQCNDVSMQLFIAIVVALVAYIPTLFIDTLRMYENYDVNCQKVLATLISACTLAGCILTYIQYTEVCLESFYEGAVSYARDGKVVDSAGSFEETVAIVINFDWRYGNGMICLFAGFGCKVIDLLCNCFIPTPMITRDRNLQEEYEKLVEDESSSEDESDED
jgi:hypothetical protein